MRHLLSMTDLSGGEIERIFAITEDLKAKFAVGVRETLLPGRVLAMVFEKPSLRTRASFEAAMAHLGGGSYFLGPEAGFGERESVADFTRALSQYVDVLVARSRRHDTVEMIAQYSSCPVINGLTDLSHPCQAMADLYTLKELLGPLEGRTLAFVGDGNNVARSLAIGCGRLGMRMHLTAPKAYQFDAEFRGVLEKHVPELELTVSEEPLQAVREADAIYTDVWASMGQEGEAEKRRREFADYQVNEALLSAAPDDAVFMHCLPARRGEEVTDDVIDGPQSVIVQQASNRLHVQKGILAWLLGVQK